MAIAWLLARWWGITDDQTITRGQRKLLIAAGVLFSLSWLPFPRFPKYPTLTRAELPTGIESFVLASLAACVTAVDIWWSSSVGHLAYPAFYDGIGYLFTSKRAFYLLSSLFDNPQILRNNSFPDLLFSPLWSILLIIHYSVLGVGEWQAYAARFWPTFLLSYLMLWLVRKESNGRIAWMAVGFTAMLPTISVSIRQTVLQFYFPLSYGGGWYLADLRPDLLFAVLVLGATAPVVQYANDLDSDIWVRSGTAAALALLTKPSAVSILALAWGLAIAVALFVNRTKIRETLVKSIWGVGLFLILVIPWVALGGLGRIFRYIYQAAVSQRELWSDPNATLWTEATYYWHWFAQHMGAVESWLFLAFGLIFFFLSLTKRLAAREIASIAYLVIATLLYAIISLSPSKNYFLGLPFCLVLWLFSWVSLSQVLNVAGAKNRMALFLPTTVVTVYLVFIFSAFCYAVNYWPPERIQAATRIRAATQAIVADLNGVLMPGDHFLSAPLFGIPATFQFDMIQRDGSYPRQCRFNPLASPPERVVEDLVNCKAVLLYSSDEDQRRLSPAPRPALLRWETVARHVKNPVSGYRLFRAYILPEQSPYSQLSAAQGNFTMELYLLETSASSNDTPPSGTKETVDD